MPNSIACIEFGVKGITNHMVGGEEASLYALWQSVVSLKDTMANQMVVCAFDSISDEHIRLIELQENSHEILYSESSVALRLKFKDDSDEKFFCEILGIGFASDDNRSKSLEKAIARSIDDADISSNDVSFFVSNSYLTDDFYKHEKKAIENALYDNIPVIMPKRYFGDNLSASVFMSMMVICTVQDHKLPFKFINKLKNQDDSKVYPGDIAVLAGYNNTGDSISICIKIGGKNGY
jgi:3-oxoacyl-(acyl-carrier-protein) synthase